MTLRWQLALIAAGVALVAIDPALARPKHKAETYKTKAHCADRPLAFTWSHIWNAPEPRPNGCAPPVFVDGQFIGQDPDRNIRFQLQRDPDTGYKQIY